jgi:outer membrane immunogenic protein
MNKLLILSATALALTAAEAAVAADLPLEPVAKASFVSRFTWTGCYLGAHVGGAWQPKDATDPVLLVQDGLAGPGTTVGATTAGLDSNGVIYGGQIGCDYQFAPNFVVGVEGAVSAGALRGSTLVPLPANPGDTALVTARTDFIPSLTARLGYAVDHWLFYGKGGVAWTNDKYSVTGNFTGIPFDAEGLGMRTGWTAGAGVEWAFADNWSARLEYDYYDFGHANVLMSDVANGFASTVTFRQSAQMVKLGLNFRVGQ